MIKGVIPIEISMISSITVKFQDAAKITRGT